MSKDALKQLVLEMDTALGRQQSHRLTLGEAEALLETVSRFNTLAAHEKPMPVQAVNGMAPPDAGTGPHDPDTAALLLAGYRLCSDLTERVMMRLVDIYQDRQHSIDFMNAELRRKVRDRHAASVLIGQAQQSRNYLSDTGSLQGLGVFI